MEDQAYNLIRRWRRGEINGNQFDYNLAMLGVSEDFCYGVARTRDVAELKAIAKETIVLVSLCMVMFLPAIASASQKADRPLVKINWEHKR